MCQSRMPFPPLEILSQVYAQVIQPLASSAAAWITLGIAIITFGLRRVCFPCITLGGLKHTVHGVERLLKDYKNKLPVYHDSIFDCGLVVDLPFVDFQSRLLRCVITCSGSNIVTEFSAPGRNRRLERFLSQTMA